MLKNLVIKNLAIIDDISIDFEENLNILTGQTGAGKSIIIDAIGLLFGKRASQEIIAYGKDQAFIQALIFLEEPLASEISTLINVDVKDEFVISRTITSNGRSTLKVNGVIVPLFTINEIASKIIDISGQNESQYLLNSKTHLALLDSYIENSVPKFKEKYNILYLDYKKIKDEFDELSNETVNEDELEFLKFKYNEIKDYNYSIDDEDQILNEYKNLRGLEKSMESISEIVDYFDNDNHGVINNLYLANKELKKISTTSKLEDYSNRLESLYLDLADLVDSFKQDFSSDNFDEGRIEYLENEITKINTLKRKYKTTNLLEYKNNLKNQIELIENREIVLSKLSKKVKESYNLAYKEASYISNIRKEYAFNLSKEVKDELVELYLNDATFEVNFEDSEISKEGIDKLEFYMSANKGVPTRPLIKVASGGEVSRIMLGLKRVFSKLSNVDIIIFDEIDTGVSGAVAQAMGKKMKKISSYTQVLAITHLPQVAAIGDYNYFISKEVINDKTSTKVSLLDKEGKLNEVARLLSGDKITSSFINAAKELILSK